MATLICRRANTFPKILGSLCFTVSPLGSRQISSPAPKLDVEGLPLVQFKGKVYVLKGNNDEYKFQKEISELCKSGVLGFDTETTSQYQRGRYLPSLVQLSNDNTCIMWRLRRFNENSAVTSTWISHTLANILMSPDILKVGHGSCADAKDLLQRYHLEMCNFHDTHQLAIQLGLEHLSLRGLVALFLNRKLDKSLSISDWEATSLSTEQVSYAATDAWASLKVYHYIIKEAKKCNKELSSPIKRTFNLLKPFFQEKILDRIRTNRSPFSAPPQSRKNDGCKSSDTVSEVQGEQGHSNDHEYTDPIPSVLKPYTYACKTSEGDIKGNIDYIPRVIKSNGFKRSFSGSKSTAGGSYGPPIVEREVYERKTIERWFLDPEGKPLSRPYVVEKKYKEIHKEQKEDKEIHKEQKEDTSEKREQ